MRWASGASAIGAAGASELAKRSDISPEDRRAQFAKRKKKSHALRFGGKFRRMSSASPRIAFRRLIEQVGPVDQVGIEERVAKFTTRSIKKNAKLWGLMRAASMVDLTTLEGKDTPGKVASLCQKALHPHDEAGVPPVAAVCVYPAMVRHAKKHVADSTVKVASVATAFPSGQAPLKTRLAEVRGAVTDGADEIDMVINRGAFLAGEFSRVQDEIAQVVDACGDAALKVILEVSELETFDNIRAASFLAMQVIREGDFIKTSTGKTSLNATLGNNQVMIEAIRDFYLDTGRAIGMKPAGGIRTAKQALHFLVAVKETLGDAWLTNERYRFGASSLLNDLLRQIVKEKSGSYQAPYYFTEAAESY
jgi:deoxyribose-phosphate aldolase